MRSPGLAGCISQCRPGESLAEWPDDRIWSELQSRFEMDGGFRLNEGPIFHKSVTAMRAFVTEPMRMRPAMCRLRGELQHVQSLRRFYGSTGIQAASRTA